MGTGSGLQILLVEDELSHAVLIERTLANAGFEGKIISVDTIAKARTYLRHATPNLVICDFLLPDGSGEDLLPGSLDAADYPVILMTSHGDEGVAVSALKSGAVDYVVKSDRSIAEMPALIDRVLTEWELRMQARQANSALREREQFLSGIFDAIRDGMCVLDTDLTILKANSWIEKLVPHLSPLEGRKCSDIFCGHTQCSICPANAVFGSGTAQSAEVLFFEGEGRGKWFEESAFPLLDGSGSMVGSIIHYKDITQHKENEERNRALEAQLNQAQKLESIGQLAGGIAHDFNNLLTTIIGNSELALLDLDSDAAAYEEVGEINVTAHRAALLTKQLLGFSRRQAAEPEEIDVHEVLANTEAFLSRLIGEEITLETKVTEPLWRIWMDPVQLDQVLTNLLVNARDAMPDGGKVQVGASNIVVDGASGKAESGIDPGEYVCLEVVDTGTGMSEDVKRQIFEPFFTTKDRGKGSGLGLATCYGIVRQNKGAIELETYPGRGTSFSVYLPRYKGIPGTVQAEANPPSPTRGTETILVVEDESAIRSMMSRMLEASGYQVLAADSGESALAILRSDLGPGIKLIVSDVIMPGIDGNEMAEQARELFKDVRVLFITGYSEDILGARGIINAEINYIQKPFSRDQLLSAVRHIFDMPE
jgi:PAS domain S-box-containing protein